MNADKPWHLGVIEGFFGQAWSWQARTEHLAFLAQNNFSAYIYAPKADAFLRRQWQQPWPQEQHDALIALSRNSKKTGISFGIGLSPFELYLDFSAARKQDLRNKLDAINVIAPDLLCLLFDDMTGSLETLAAKQLEIMDFVCAHSTARQFILCPTYYSSDPRLARLFGSPPQDYLRELGSALDPRIDVFWTGPQVISREYPAAHLREVCEQLQRKPVLWDNYPVNDTRNLTTFLHLLPFSGRSAELRELCNGHFANPMNQACLSQLPLHTLPLLYQGADPDQDKLFEQACEALCPPELATALQEDAEFFQHQGLTALSENAKTRLIAKYEKLPHAMAAEIVMWLQGSYTFDPACLT